MSEDHMEVDESQVSRKAKSLDALIGGSFPASLSKLSSSSRAIPANKDFHFFYNFGEFKHPIDEIAGNSQSILETIGGATQVWGKPMRFAGDIDGDEAYDWLVNVNDEIFERFDVTMDEFERTRRKEEEIGRPLGPADDVEENGFQMVYGKKKKKAASKEVAGSGRNTTGGSATGVRVAERDKKVSGAGKAKVPFHIRTIKKPQEEYNILVNNANQPFEHVWLERSENGHRFIHPLEKLSVMDFVDKNVGETEPIEPPLLEETPFKLVEEVKDLKDLAAKLRSVEEFAVDLEHNQYRSFQGLTCLMQISTRTEDFIVDTFKLRIHIGPYLREVFKDPRKKKVMHGADRDILWLQRDFGIYVCNLFDTGQASRVLKLERNSLEFLLQHFCGIAANKEYQNADWRIRPLPDEMIRYAREDTHHLLYIYDVMKIRLQTMPKEDEQSDSPLVEVYKRSYDLCMQLYEKEILTENSYLHVYGLQGAGFNAVQLAIVAGLCEWRDVIARAEDESTGYVLPNKTLLEIAKEMPVTAGKLHRLLKSKHPYIERNIGSVVSVIRHSMQNAAAFEAAAQILKEGRPRTVLEKNKEASNRSAAVVSEAPTETEETSPQAEAVASPNLKERCLNIESSNKNRSTVSVNRNEGRGMFPSAKVSSAVQVSKKPSSGFGALLGSAASKRKLGSDKKQKEEIKVEQIRSSVNLPFHSFSPAAQASISKADDVIVLEDDSDGEPAAKTLETTNAPNGGMEKPSGVSSPTQKPEGSGSNQDDVILLDDDSSEEEPAIGGNSESGIAAKEEKKSSREMDAEDEQVSLSELSENFQKCFNSTEQSKKSKNLGKHRSSGGFMSLKSGFLNIKPFDYEAARKQVKFGGEKGGGGEENRKKMGDSGKTKGSGGGQTKQKSGSGNEFAPGKRRQAFPASGNRSATFI